MLNPSFSSYLIFVTNLKNSVIERNLTILISTVKRFFIENLNFTFYESVSMNTTVTKYK